MGVTVQVRNLDAKVQEVLKSQALKAGISLSEYLRRKLTEIAERERVHERWQRAVDDYERERSDTKVELRPIADIAPDVVIDAIHAGREERDSHLENLWPTQR